MTNTNLQILLRSIKACDEAILWVGERDLKTAWAECERGDWMLWLCGKMLGTEGWPTRQQIVLAACDCAALSLPIFEGKYPEDTRPRTTIETTRKWANGEASLDDVKSAAYAASRAASAAFAPAYAVSGAAYAAYAASDAAYAASDAAYAAFTVSAASVANTVAAASAAVAAAAAGLVRVNMLKACADICRKKLYIPS